MTLSQADLQALVELAREQMLDQHFDLPQVADGNCGLACDMMFDLAELLLPEARMEEVHFTANRRERSPYDCGCCIPLFTYAETPHRYYLGGCNYPGHIVFWIEGTAIDWTARQFTNDAPFPLLFELKLGGQG